MLNMKKSWCPKFILACTWLIFSSVSSYAGIQTTKGFFDKPALGARGIADKALFDAGLDRVDARLGKEIWVGDPNYGATLQTALTTIGSSTPVVLRAPAGTHSIADDLTVPANVTLKAERGASFAVASAKTMTINGGFEAGLYQIFSCTGTGKVVFGPGAVKEVYPEWWATNSTPGSTNMTAALQAADTAAASGPLTVRLLATSYLVTAKITKDPHTHWQGVKDSLTDDKGTRLVCGYSGIMVEIDGTGTTYSSYAKMSNLDFKNNPATYGSATAINLLGCPRQLVFEHIDIYGFYQGFIGVGAEIYVKECFWEAKYPLNACLADSWFFKTHLGGNCGYADGYSYLYSSKNVTFDSCRFQVMFNNATFGNFILRGSRNITFIRPIVDQGDGHGIWIDNSFHVDLICPAVYMNGTVGVNKSGIYIRAHGYQVPAANVDTSADTVRTSATPDFDTGTRVRFTGSDLPGGIAANTEYYLSRVPGTTDTFNLYKAIALYGGLADKVDITSQGTGTHTMHGVTADVKITGGWSGDLSNGNASYQRQDTGVRFAKDASSFGYLRDILLDGLDLTMVATPLAASAYPDESLRIINCPGVALIADNGDVSLTLTSLMPVTQRWVITLTAARSCQLPTTGNYDGKVIRVVRVAGGAFDLTVKNIAGTVIKTLSAANTWVDCTYKKASAEWFVTASGSL